MAECQGCGNLLGGAPTRRWCQPCKARRLADQASARYYRRKARLKEACGSLTLCLTCGERVGQPLRCEPCMHAARSNNGRGSVYKPSSPVTNLDVATLRSATRKPCPRCGGFVVANMDTHNTAVFASCLICSEIVLDTAVGEPAPEFGRLLL